MSEAAPSVFIYGAGRVGLAIARLARERGLVVVGLWNARPLSPGRARLAQGFALAIAAAPPRSEASLWLIAVPDDAIAAVARGLAAADGPRPQAAAHTAGAHPGSLLAPIAAEPIACGSWHPAMTFRGEEADTEALAGAWVAIEGTPPAVDRLEAFTRALGLSRVVIASDRKAEYHAALVLASNGRMALDRAASELLEAAGLSPEAARTLLEPLVMRTEANLRAEGPVRALTGPAARGDARTIEAELEALANRPSLKQLYRALAAVQLDLVPPEVRGEGHAAVAERIRQC